MDLKLGMLEEDIDQKRHSVIQSIDFKNILLSLLGGVLGSTLFMAIYNHTYDQSFGVIRMDKIMATHLNDYGKRNLSSEEREIIAKKFSKVLEVTINQISNEERVILLVAPATVSKMPDYTERVEAAIHKVFYEK
ncbi:MAG: TrbI F-type domain-containing protein [Oligoflexia bacterium]|nr:TrbI F-type domain-containing protein [Oligoflexia bacterium]